MATLCLKVCPLNYLNTVSFCFKKASFHTQFFVGLQSDVVCVLGPYEQRLYIDECIYQAVPEFRIVNAK